MNLGPRFALLCLPLLAGACVTEGEEVASPDSEFLEASLLMQEQIDRYIADLPYLSGTELIDAMYWLNQRGETAYQPMIDHLHNENAKMRSIAVNVLCMRRDRRVLPYVQSLANDPSMDVRREVARGLMRLGDWSGVDVLVAGLDDDSRYVRALCARFLRDQTRVDFGYEPDAPPQDREVAVQKWRTWATNLKDQS